MGKIETTARNSVLNDICEGFVESMPQTTMTAEDPIGQRVFWCNGQGSYMHGATMCTTACMQVGMAMLCGQIDLVHISAGPHTAGSTEKQVSGALNWCMNAASTVHGRIETLLHRREQQQAQQQSLSRHLGQYCNDEMHPSLSPNRMVSVNEVITLLGINLGSLGVCMEELVVCKTGVETRLKERGLQDASAKKRSLKYEAESCFVGLGHVPLCMEVSHGGGACSENGASQAECCVAFFTANSHTVCAACYPRGGRGLGAAWEYAFFDPSPGQLQTGLSAAQLVSAVARTLSVPPSVCSSVEAVRQMAEELGAMMLLTDSEDAWKARKKRMGGKEGVCKTVTWAECLDDVGQPTGVQMAKVGKRDRSSISLDNHWEFQCDVTLMFIRG